MTDTVVRVRGLDVRYRVARHRTGDPQRPAATGIDFDIAEGGTFGLVGESGSGKSTIALALTHYLPAGARVSASDLVVAGERVLELGPAALRRYRRDRIGVVYQEPALALNPTTSVGAQIAEVFRLRGTPRSDAAARTVQALGHVGLPHPEALARRYPHELSGGQQQRVVIAMALATHPKLLILDEPTTGLDTRVEADIFALVAGLRDEQRFATLLISHDLPLVAAQCEQIGVLKDGRLVEQGAVRDLLDAPSHPYTRELLSAVPALDGPVPAAVVEARGAATAGEVPLVRISHVTKSYGGVAALDDVSLTIGRGEVLGLVGESGSGKTTLGRAVAGLTRFAGEIVVDAPAGSAPVQVVFQSPDASLNPRRTVRQVLSRSIRLLGGDTDAVSLAELAGLPRATLDRLPHELSGGQKQRVAIARAFAGPVPLVVCDEPTSALDVTLQARILDLFAELRATTGVSYLFITHDLAVVRRLADSIAVLRGGHLVDQGTAEEILAGGRHEYTESLVAAARSLRVAAAR